MTKQNTFYLAKVKLRNIQCFESLSADFLGEGGDIRLCSVLLGDNSAGKTAFLRSLALGICYRVNAMPGLMDDYFQGDLLQDEKQDGSVEIELIHSEKGRYRIETEIERIPDAEQLITRVYHIPDKGSPELLSSPKSFPMNDLFVCAYGAGRALGETTRTYRHYRITDAVSTLFHYDQPMQHPELSLRRIIAAAQKNVPESKRFHVERGMLLRFQNLIEKLFMFTAQERIELTEKGIEVVSPEGRSPLPAQGDGYKNTAAWVLDFITWNMLAGRNLDLDEMSGILMIDEIEQHLHPRWQRHIISLLREQFPKIQFIVTTHSPLCAAGTADLNDHETQLLQLHKEDHGQTALNLMPSLRGLRADQVLTSEAFGLPTTRNPDLAEKLRRFGYLFLKESRNEQEEQEFLKLREFLDEYLPESAEDAEARVLQQKLKRILKDLEGLPDIAKG